MGKLAGKLVGRVKQRAIGKIRYTPEDVGPHTIDRVYSMWRAKVPILEMLRKVNSGFTTEVSNSGNLSYVDLYAIVAVGIRNKAIRPRTVSGELDSIQFAELFKYWRAGKSERDIIGLLGLPKSLHKAAHNIYDSLGRKFRAERQAYRELSTGNSDAPKNAASIAHALKSTANVPKERIADAVMHYAKLAAEQVVADMDHTLLHARRINLEIDHSTQHHQGKPEIKPALIVFESELPEQYRHIFRQYPTMQLTCRFITEKVAAERALKMIEDEMSLSVPEGADVDERLDPGLDPGSDAGPDCKPESCSCAEGMQPTSIEVTAVSDSDEPCVLQEEGLNDEELDNMEREADPDYIEPEEGEQIPDEDVDRFLKGL